ncbi:MAG: hypothetical protein LJE65_02580 [Desulfobacteraceae bacterium]|nr:hypothetical protein [Desulfobacteraceae bacterium]
MKQYVIDELRPGDYQRLKRYLDARLEKSSMGGLYWLFLGDDVLSETQSEHESCRPHYFALELEPHRLCCELLVRSQQRIRCHCIAYATQEQRDWLVHQIDSIFEHLDIMT